MQVPLPPMSRWEDRNREFRDFRRVTQFISTIAVLEARCFHSWAPYFSPLAVWLTGEGMPGKVGWWGHPGLVRDQGQSEEISPPDHHIFRVLVFNLTQWSNLHYAVEDRVLDHIPRVLLKNHIYENVQRVCDNQSHLSGGLFELLSLSQVVNWIQSRGVFFFFFRLGSGRLQTSRSYGLGLHYLSVSIKSSHLQSIRVHIPSPRHHRSPSCLFLRQSLMLPRLALNLLCSQVWP